MDFKKLKKEIAAGDIKDIYILVGEEKEVMKKYIAQIDPNYITANGIEEIAPLLRAKSLIPMKKTYVIPADKVVKKMKLKEIEQIIGNNRLIITSDASDARLSLFKSGKGVLYSFDRITNAEAYVRQLLNIEDPTLSTAIAKRCGDSIALIEMECDKLLHLGQPITLELINELIYAKPENRIWDFVNMILTGNAEQVFEYYYELKELKESEVKFVHLLFTGFKNVILVQGMADLIDRDVAAKTGLTLWQVKKTRELTGNIPLDRLLHNLGQVHKLEIDIKTGKVDAELGFKNLLLELLKG